MAVTSGLVGSGEFQESFGRNAFSHAGSQMQYRVYRESTRTSFECRSADGKISAGQRIDYFVGSGRVGRSYLFSIDNFLYQAPVSYYAASSRWDLSPGYERYDYLYFARPVEPACLRCHASRVLPLAGTQNGFESVPFLEAGIGCEMCHGEGDEHVRQNGRQAKTHAIVNPARLTSEQRDSICAQCHLSGVARVEKSGRDLGSFRPGDRLSDYLSVFVRTDVPEDMKVTSHVEKLAVSRCKLASGERMSCSSCHDAHQVPADGDKISYFRKKCLECHAARPCTERPAVRLAADNNCIGCHMPRNTVVDVQHAAYTDHSIPRRPGGASKAASRDCRIEPFSGTRATERDLALSYAQVAIEKNNQVCGSWAFELLRKLEPLNPRDPAILLQLAYLYDLRSNEAEAMALYERALEADPSQVTAAINLGAALSQRGRADRAMQLWKDALTRSPGAETASLNLALAQYRTGDIQSAAATITRALRLSPGSDKLRKLLSQLHTTAPK